MRNKATKIELDQSSAIMEVVREPETSRLKIWKAKLTKNNTLDVDYNEHHEDDTIAVVGKSCPYLVHDDLLNALQVAAPHLIILCGFEEIIRNGEFVEPPEKYSEEDCEKIKVTGFQIAGIGDEENITLFGKRMSDYGIIEIKTFKIPVNSGYPFATELKVAVEQARNEVLLYLKGHHGHKQMEMAFDEPVEHESEGAEE